MFWARSMWAPLIPCFTNTHTTSATTARIQLCGCLFSHVCGFCALWYIVFLIISRMSSNSRLELTSATPKSLFTVASSTNSKASPFVSVWLWATAWKMTPKCHIGEKWLGGSTQDLPQFITLQDGLIWNAAWVAADVVIRALLLYHCDSLLLLCLSPGLSCPPFIYPVSVFWFQAADTFYNILYFSVPHSTGCI